MPRGAENLLKPDPYDLPAIMLLAVLLSSTSIWHLPSEFIISTTSYLTVLFLPVFADI